MLRILTLNTQFRSTVMEAGNDLSNIGDAPERAKALVSVIGTTHSSYDVLAFNEVFDESARDNLVKGLKPIYPHVVEKMPAKFSVDQIGSENSGLMVFSKLPITFSKELIYGGGTGLDGLALKGALLVRLAEASIIATHTQSDGDPKAMNVRAGQMAELSIFITEEIKATGNGMPVLVMGDMNINGNHLLRFGSAVDQQELNEWHSFFDPSTGTVASFVLATLLKEAWSFEFLPDDPNKLTKDRTDAGLTCGMSRYDYVLTSHPVLPEIKPNFKPLALHRMRLAYELFTRATADGKSSDHIGIVTHLQKDNGGLTPRKAVTLVPSNELGPAHSGPLTRFDGECLLDGAQWLQIDAEGSYGFSLISKDNSATYTTFLASDFSRSMLNYKRETLEIQLHQGKVKFDKYVVPSAPFYILVQSTRRDRSFKYQFRAYRLIGTNPTEAVLLVDHDTNGVEFKVGAPHSLPIQGVPNDTTDGVWFRIDPIELTMGKSYKATVHVNGAQLNKPTLTLLRDGKPMTVVQQFTKTSLPQSITFETKGNERLYLVVQRNDPTFKTAAAIVRYESPVSLFHGIGQGIPGGGVMQIKCDDETNPEILESDDISLEVSVDGKHFRTITNSEIGDFDDGDVKPLEPFFQNPIAFVEFVSFKVIDEDPGDDESGTIVFPALANTASNAFHLKQSVQFAEGTYSVLANLSRYYPR